MNLENRIEAVYDLDVATALVNAAEMMVNDSSLLGGKILNIGGGKENGFQIRGRDMTIELFKRMGMGQLDENCFAKEDYFIDWMDTGESQALLRFQNHDFEGAMRSFMAPFKKLRPVIRLFAPFIRRSLERQSPWCGKNH